jgi:hypothetical protein
MPSLGSGLSLGTLNKIQGFDFDASTYITNNAIPNSTFDVNPLTSPTNSFLIGKDSSNLGSASIAHNSSLNLNSKSWSFGFWVTPFYKGSDCMVLAKSGGNDTREFQFQINIGSSLGITFQLNIFQSGTYASRVEHSIVSTSVASSLNEGEKVFVYMGYNYSEQKSFISINGGTKVYSSSTISNTYAGTNSLKFGYFETGTLQNIMSIDEVGFWNRDLSQTEISKLYNSGDGVGYSQLTSDEKTNLVSWWSMDETSGNRADSHGTNTILNSNMVNCFATIPQVAGNLSFTNPQTKINDAIINLKNSGLWANLIDGFFFKRDYNSKTTTPKSIKNTLTTTYTSNSNTALNYFGLNCPRYISGLGIGSPVSMDNLTASTIFSVSRRYIYTPEYAFIFTAPNSEWEINWNSGGIFQGYLQNTQCPQLSNSNISSAPLRLGLVAQQGSSFRIYSDGAFHTNGTNTSLTTSSPGGMQRSVGGRWVNNAGSYGLRGVVTQIYLFNKALTLSELNSILVI